MKLFGSLTSPYVRKIRIQLLEKAIPFALDVDDVWKPGSTASRLNPLGKVPCVVLSDGQTLFDSALISEALELLYPQIPLLPSAAIPRLQARLLETLGAGISEAAVACFLERRFHDPDKISTVWLDRQMAKVTASMAHLDGLLLQSKAPFLAGDAFGLADISVVCAVQYVELRLPQLVWREQFHVLSTYLDRLAMRSSVVDTLPPTQ
jgi:glutathione S-transferase